MAVTIAGPRISFNESNDYMNINCPIKRLQLVGGGANSSVIIDGQYFNLTYNNVISFESLFGYPGGKISVATISTPIAILITEIGDVLNPNYFKEDIRNWNGQGAAASVSETESKARSRTKKAEVTE